MSNEKRNTEYTIVVHKNDLGFDGKPIFDRLETYCHECFSYGSTTELYFILHDSDLDKETGEIISIKEPHYHIAIRFKYNCGKTFETMKNKYFPSSHIEPCVDFPNAVLYLTHETANAKRDGKTLYNRDLVCNLFNTDIKKYYNMNTVEPFNLDCIIQYIRDDGLRTILDFGYRFGFSAVKPYWSYIKEIMFELGYRDNF